MSGTPEEIKAASRHLRGTIAEELVATEPAFGHDSIVLLKFHGIYQQDDRDTRRARTQAKAGLDYSCMVRAAVPGGRLEANQWLALDKVAELADATLRVTTRQGIQFHTVQKGSLRPLIGSLNDNLLTTLAACGDVVRNTMACPAPLPDGRQAVLRPALDQLVQRFRPHTRGYWEIWVDGEKAVSAEASPDEHEPVYGPTYLPRKFKIGLAWPGDNCVDVYTQDVGLVPTLSGGTTGDLTGWVVLVGGGLGMSHAREEDTYPRLATPLCWVPPGQLTEAVEAVITTQRDHGNRGDRHRARLKYLVDERGLPWFRTQIEERLGGPVADPVPLQPWLDSDDHLGWFTTDAGDWALGVPVPSGRVRDLDDALYRSALREVFEQGLAKRALLTGRQDVILDGVTDADRARVESTLGRFGVPLADSLTPVSRLAVACPALPTCGQALGEAERVLPDIVAGIDGALSGADLDGHAVRVNVTGCPNGCARPYTAEIGIVGRTKRNYDLYVGGSVGGERLAERLRADVPLGEMPALLAPVFARFAADGTAGESFGDYCARVGTAHLETLLPAPARRRRAAASQDDE